MLVMFSGHVGRLAYFLPISCCACWIIYHAPAGGALDSTAPEGGGDIAEQRLSEHDSLRAPSPQGFDEVVSARPSSLEGFSNSHRPESNLGGFEDDVDRGGGSGSGSGSDDGDGGGDDISL